MLHHRLQPNTRYFYDHKTESKEVVIRTTPNPSDKYVCLFGIEHRNRFFTGYHGDKLDDIVRLSDGTIAYEIISFAETMKEAQIILYGRSFTKSED